MTYRSTTYGPPVDDPPPAGLGLEADTRCCNTKAPESWVEQVACVKFLRVLVWDREYHIHLDVY